MVEPRPFSEPTFENLEKLDASAGFDAPAVAHLEQIDRGDDAISWHETLDGGSRADAERQLRAHWRKVVPWIDISAVDFTYDELHHAMRLTMDGKGTMDWRRNGSVRDFDIGDSNLGFTTSFAREPGPRADAPFKVDYPSYSRWTVMITLPQKGADFRLVGAPANVDKTIAGRRYQRHTVIENGVVTMVADEQSLAPEFPASEATSAAAQLRELDAFNVVVRGPAASPITITAAEEAPEQPSSAADFSRRGISFLSKRDFDQAVADFSEAIRLEPNQAKHFYNRGAARYEKGQDDLALQDFDQALRLNPQDALAYMARAELYLGRNDDTRAAQNFDQAQRLSPGDVKILTRKALAYNRAGRYDQAVRGYDAAIALSPEQARNAAVLNERCWSRAEWGRELEDALADCSLALTLKPGTAAILDSRGLVRLRLGQYDLAIADYNDALRLSPRQASSLFGRAVAKSRKGDRAGAEADLAAAAAIDGQIAATYARFGVKPPSP